MNRGSRLVGFLKRTSGVGLIVCLLNGVVPGCAAIEQTSRVRANPLEAPRTHRVPLGPGLAVQGERQGPVVVAKVEVVDWCAIEQLQRADGVRITERTAVGNSLTVEWLFGGLLTATGSGLLAYTAFTRPTQEVEGELSMPQASGWAYSGGITAVGVALLAGAAWQQLSLGVHETPLGEREMQKRGAAFVCARKPAAAGQVRLTLSDGSQLEAQANESGEARIELPADIDERLKLEGRRATLEAVGDPSAQVRIEL